MKSKFGLTPWQKFKVLMFRIHIFIIRCAAFGKPVCIDMKIDGLISIDQKDGIVANCTFIGDKE